MFSWLKSHWKSVATLVVATAVFAAVTVLTGGLGAPLLVSLAAGGASSGIVAYVMGELLDGRTPTAKGAVIQGALGAGIAVATLGVGRVLAPVAGRVLAPVVARVSPAVASAAGNVLAGGALGAGTQAVENVVTGRPVGENVGTATALGALNGALMNPATRLSQAVFRARVPVVEPRRGGLAVEPETAPPPPSENLGMVKALELGVKSEGEGRVVDRKAGPVREKQSYTEWKKSVEPALVDPIADAKPFMKDVPSLANDVQALEAAGWKIRYGEPGKGSWCNAEKSPPEIVIDPSEDATSNLRTLAHEVGHAKEAPTPVRDPLQMSREDYVRTRVQDMTLSEGQAVLNENLALEELAKAVQARTGKRPFMVGETTPFYRWTATDQNLTVDQKIRMIGERYMSSETPSSTERVEGENYLKYWERLFAEDWDGARAAAQR